MKIQVIFCDDSFIYRQRPELGSGFGIVKENENALFTKLDNSTKDYQKQLVAVPWDTLEQRESYALSQFAKRYNKEKNREVDICYLSRKQGESRLDYLNNSINRIASMYAHDQVEIEVYIEEEENGEGPFEIEEYFKGKSIPWNITLNIHELVNGKDQVPLSIVGSSLINEHKYDISASPLQAEINELKVKLSESKDDFVRTTLGHLAILLLEKGNLHITANNDEPNERSVLIIENPLQQLLRRYNAAITAIMEQYKQYAPKSSEQISSEQIAIKTLITQALALASALSTKSKVGAFFSEPSYCSVRDFELTTVFLENVNELLKAPCKDRIDIVLDNLQNLNSQGKAPYLVGAGIVLAGLCMIPGPGLGLLALGFTGVFALSAAGFIAAMSIAVTVAPIFGIVIGSVGLDCIAKQHKEDGIKNALQTAINSLKAALNGEILSDDLKPKQENEDGSESEYRIEDISESKEDEASVEESSSEGNTL